MNRWFVGGLTAVALLALIVILIAWLIENVGVRKIIPGPAAEFASDLLLKDAPLRIQSRDGTVALLLQPSTEEFERWASVLHVRLKPTDVSMKTRRFHRDHCPYVVFSQGDKERFRLFPRGLGGAIVYVPAKDEATYSYIAEEGGRSDLGLWASIRELAKPGTYGPDEGRPSTQVGDRSDDSEAPPDHP